MTVTTDTGASVIALVAADAKLPTVLDTALAACDPILDRMVKAQESIVMLNVELGKAFGKAIATAHPEPLFHDAFSALYADPIAQHIKARCGYATDRAVLVVLRVANLVAAGKTVPGRDTVKKKSGTEKPLSDTAYGVVLIDAQKKAGLQNPATARVNNGGDNRTPEQIKAAADKAAADLKAAADKLNATPEMQAINAVAAAQAAADIPPQVPAKGNDPAGSGSPQVPPTIDTAKVREDAAATLMGNAKHGDLLLQAIKSRKAALIKFLENK